MIKAGRCSSAQRKQHVFKWIPIIWLTSAVGSGGLELKAASEVLAKCGDNVTLACTVTSSEKLDIFLFSWLHCNETGCQKKADHLQTQNHHSLNLTLNNVGPVDNGRYLCKLRSNRGVKSANTSLSLQDCSKNAFINRSHAECFFSSVYPGSTVHWFQGEDNLTDIASTTEELDQHGWYIIQSKIPIKQRDGNQAYNCMLWKPEEETYLSSQQVIMVKETKSLGSVFKLQWICFMVGIMMSAL